MAMFEAWFADAYAVYKLRRPAPKKDGLCVLVSRKIAVADVFVF